MTAVLLTGYGGFDRLELRDDVPVPQPGEGDVLLKVAAAGVNNTDINTRIGWYAADVVTATADGDAAVPTARTDVGWSGNVPTFPRIQGADACGRIVAVGSGAAYDPAAQTATLAANLAYEMVSLLALRQSGR